MDGLPSFQRGLKTSQEKNVAPIKKMVGPEGELVLARQHYPSKWNLEFRVQAWRLLVVGLLGFALGIVATMVLEKSWGNLKSLGLGGLRATWEFWERELRALGLS
jgi:hypothetical protein